MVRKYFFYKGITLMMIHDLKNLIQLINMIQ